MDTFDVSKIKAAMKTAFGRLKYSVELDDFDEKVKVEVFDEKGKTITKQLSSIDLVSDTNNLDTFIRNCRDAVEATGYDLPPWSGLDSF